MKMEEICGRERPSLPIYRVKAPLSWRRQNPSPEESLIDTTKSLCEFYLSEGEETIRVTIHNFPSRKIEDRIPPAAQITRWKKQFANLEPTTVFVTPQAWGGFAGFLFEGSGLINDAPVSMMAWSMQLAWEHYRNLYEASPQIRADFTVKATGSKEMMKKYRKAIIDFARSFELIEEIPSHS